MNIEILEAKLIDLPYIKQFMKELYVELGEESDSIAFLDEELIKEVLNSGRTIVLKALNEEMEVVGMLSLTETLAIYAGGFYGVIDEMYVKAEFRSEKVGEVLIKHAIELGKGRGWKRIDVTTPTEDNERTLNFYKKNGFTFTGLKLKYKL